MPTAAAEHYWDSTTSFRVVGPVAAGVHAYRRPVSTDPHAGGGPPHRFARPPSDHRLMTWDAAWRELFHPAASACVCLHWRTTPTRCVFGSGFGHQVAELLASLGHKFLQGV